MRPSTTLGSPALGSTLIGSAECWDRKRRCSCISAGPVAQLMPSTSGRIAPSDTRAAPISLPTSIRPVVSIVTWTCSGTARPADFIARRQAIIAALTWRRSMHVSMRNRSTPPSRSPAACSS